MRKLVIVRGCPASRKSAFLGNELGMTGHILSADAIRLIIGAPGHRTPRTGAMSIPQDHNVRVVAMLRDLMRERMERGETLAIDMVNEHLADLKPLLRLAHEHHYAVLIVDFGAVPLERALADNRKTLRGPRGSRRDATRMHATIAATPTAAAVRERADDPESRSRSPRQPSSNGAPTAAMSIEQRNG